MSKQTRFTDEFRAKAVAAAIAAGYPSKKGALSRVAGELGISHQVLRLWVVGTQNPPPQELLQEKKVELRDLIQAELNTIMQTFPNKRGDASYRELGTVFGVLFDKLQLIDELPTVVIGLSAKLKKIAALAEALNMPMELLTDNLITELEAEKAAANEGDDN